jgi:hypothetical protein
MFSKKLLASAAVISFAIAGAASAQETTSAVRGNVRSTDGTPVAGAQVVVTHVPTGAVSAEYADASGVFDLRGLRVGGPYTIEVTADDYTGQRLDNVFLQVGTPFRVALDLEPSTTEIVVTATRSGSVYSVGSATALSRDDLDGVASVGRDVRDFARRDPLVTQDVGLRGGGGSGGVSIAGSAPRSNRITVDGMAAGDDFGLVTSGLSTLRGPVSPDAVSQFSVQAVPFDVENGDFTGGALNMVLRQGTNELEGSVFVNYLNEGLVGQRVNNAPAATTVSQENYGGFIGGPIIPNVLFAAASYEYYSSLDTTLRGLANEGFANTFNGLGGSATVLTRADFNSVFNPGVAGQGYVGNYAVAALFPVGDFAQTAPIQDEKGTFRIDWDITDGQRFWASYRTAESSLMIRDYPANRADLDSSWYAAADTEEVFTAQLNSDWTSAFSTEVRASYRNYERRQAPPSGQEFGAVQICLEPGLGTIVNSATTCTNASNSGRTIIDFGPDSNRHANFLDTTNTQFSASGEYQMGAHLFKAGYQYQGIEILNLFVGQSDGIFYFDSIDAFNRGEMSRFQYTNTASGNPLDGAAAFSYAVNSLFLQDTWDITDDFTLNYGLRYDYYTSNDEPAANPYFLARNGFSNTITYDGLDVLMPRLSFTYDATNDLRISGGIGLVSGGAPDVFISNSYSNTGVLTAGVDIRRTTAVNTVGGTCFDNSSSTDLTAAQCAILLNVNKSDPNLFFDIPSGTISGQPFSAQTMVTNADPLNPANAGLALANSQTVNALGPNFEIPSDWKANLSFDTRWLGFDWGLDIVATQSRDSVAFTDTKARLLVVPNPTAADILAGVEAGQQFLPDGRARYDGINMSTVNRNLRGMAQTTNVNANRDIVAITPDETSWSVVTAVSVGREFENGVSFGLSYARQEGEDYGGYAQFGTTASGFYGEQYADTDLNGSTLGRPNGQITDSFKVDFGWRGTPIGDLESRLTLFGEIRDGRAINFLMVDPVGSRTPTFGVNRTDQLLYVPNLSNCTPGLAGSFNCGLVTFDNEANLNTFRRIVDHFGLSEGIVDKSAANNPEVVQFDLQLSQELPGLMRGHRTRLTFDVANLANLLNDEWGVIREYGDSRAGGRVADAVCATSTGAAVAAGSLVCERYRYSNVTSSVFSNTTGPTINTNESRWLIQIGLRYEF